jgi:hypothetical protein
MTQRERRKRRISSHLNILILFGDTNERKYFNFAPMRICACGVCGEDRSLAPFFFFRSLARRNNLLQRTRVFLYQNVLQHSEGREILLQQILWIFAHVFFQLFPLVTNN